MQNVTLDANTAVTHYASFDWGMPAVHNHILVWCSAITVLFNVNAGWRRVLFVEVLCKQLTRHQSFYLSAVPFDW